LLGLAAATEFPAAPAAAVIGVYYLIECRRLGALRNVRTWLLPIAGAAPFLLLQLAYDAACFGSAWSLGYANIESKFKEVHQHGLLGVGLPRPDVLAYITVHPRIGLFAQSPLLAIGLAGLVRAIGKRSQPLEAAVCLIVAAWFLVVNAGYGMWWGGATFTARHLIPAIPFLGFGLFLMPRSWWVCGVPLAIVSFAQMLIATSVNPIIPNRAIVNALAAHGSLPWDLGSNIWNVMLPELLGAASDESFSLGTLIGLSPWLSTTVLVAALGIWGVLLARPSSSGANELHAR
jgi:hypothetical protein